MTKPKNDGRTIRRGDGFVEERARLDGSIAYQARWHDGVKWRAKSFRDEDSAYDYLREIGRARRRGDYTPESDMTVAELLADYIARGAHRWSANTVATYSLISRQRIVPELGKIRVRELTTPRVQRWLDTMATRPVRIEKGVPRMLSAAIIGNARSLLSGACNEAVQLGILRANPVTGSRAPARPRGTKPTWTADDVSRVLEVIEQDRDAVTWRAYYLLSLTSGMRPGEIRAVRWQDIDLEAGMVSVRRTMTRDADFRHKIGDVTKTGRARSIAIPHETVEALRMVRTDQLRRRVASEHWIDLGLVFDRGDGNAMAQQSVSNHHRRFCDAAGVSRIRLHDLRHTYATLMLAQGVHPKIVADALGHQSVMTTLDIYSHVDVSMQRAASDALAGVLLRSKKRA